MACKYELTTLGAYEICGGCREPAWKHPNWVHLKADPKHINYRRDQDPRVVDPERFKAAIDAELNVLFAIRASNEIALRERRSDTGVVEKVQETVDDI